MGSVLSQEQMRQYYRDGALFPISVLSTDEVSRFRVGFEQLEARLGGQQKYLGWSHLFFPWAYDLATHPAVLRVIEGILGPELIVQGTLILCKYPWDPAYVSWHQDGAYSGLPPASSTSAWIALSESRVENGCMRVILGSHREGVLPHLEIRAQNNLLGHGEEVQVGVDENRASDVVLKAGEMSLHQNQIIHGSQPNRSGTKRIGFIVRFTTPQYSRSADPVIRARGQHDCGHLQLLAQPPAGAIEAGITAWKEFLRLRSSAQTNSDGVWSQIA